MTRSDTGEAETAPGSTAASRGTAFGADRRLPSLAGAALLVGALAGGAPLRAAEDASALCLRAATVAAQHSGVPLDILTAIMRVETGRAGRPWPWALNFGGDGRWADTRDEATRLVETALDAGATNIDVGCFQLNIRWHGRAFRSVDDMIEPERNARYAAAFLTDLFAETGSWEGATGAYHSRDPDRAAAYASKVMAALDMPPDAPLGAAADPDRGRAGEDPGPAAPDAPNRFPFLRAGAPASPGSLVPATSAGRRLISG